jgi:hypothetical protein
VTAVWTAEEAERIGAAEDLRITPLDVQGEAGRPVPIWIVRAGRSA